MEVRQHDRRRRQVGARNGVTQVSQGPLGGRYLLAIEDPGAGLAIVARFPGDQGDIHASPPG